MMVQSGSEWNERNDTDAGIHRKSINIPAAITSHALQRAASAHAKIAASHGGAKMTLAKSAMSSATRNLFDDIHKLHGVEIDRKANIKRLRRT